MDGGGPVELYVKGISTDATQDELRSIFSKVGTVLEVKKMAPKDNSRSSFGFIKMASAEEAQKAIEEFDQLQHRNCYLGVSVAKRKNPGDNRRTSNEYDNRRSSSESVNHRASTERVNEIPAKSPVCNGGGHSPSAKKTPPKQNGYTSGYESSHGRDSEPRGRGQNPQIGNPKGGNPSSQPSSLTESQSCTKCGKPGSTRCSLCKAIYCGRECQVADWQKDHKPICASRQAQQASAGSPTVPPARPSQQSPAVPPARASQHRPAETTPHTGSGDGPHRPSRAPQPATQTPAGDQPQPQRKLMYREAQRENLQSGSKVQVTCLESPQDFWLVLADKLPLLVGLKDAMDKFYVSTTNQASTAYVPEVGQVCAGQFTGDNGWYRSRVDRILLDGRLALTYIDFGNREEVTVTRVRRLAQEFYDPPLQASRCSLATIERQSSPYPPEVIQRCATILPENGMFTVTVVERAPDLMLVNLIHNGADVASQFVAENLLKLAKDPTKVSAPPAVHSPPSKSSGSLRAPTAAQPSRSPGTQHSPGPTEQRRSDKIPVPPLPTAAKYLAPRKEVTICAVSVPSPAEFWAQVVDHKDIHELDSLGAQMNAHYGPMARKKALTPLKNSLYACFYRDDNNWYRAQLLDFNTEKAYVLYLDFGNREVVTFDCLHSLESAFTQLPFQAVRFSLFDTTPSGDSWSKDAQKAFHQLMTAGQVKALVCDINEVFTYVEIYLPNGECVNDKLVKDGFAVKGPKIAKKPEVPRVMASDLPKLNIPEGDLVATVVDAPSPLNFIAHLAGGEFQQNLLAVTQAMSQCKPPKEPYTPVQDEMVVARFTDGDWYRARVQQVNSPKSIIVLFVDYGNLEPVSADVIVPMPSEMKLYPPLAVSCRFAGVDKQSPDIPWNAEIIMGQLFNLKIVTRGSDHYEVEMYNQETGICLNKQLLEAGIVLPKAQSVPQSAVLTLKDLPRVDRRPGPELISVMVTEAEDPTSFTVQVVEDAAQHLASLEADLARVHENYIGIYIPSSPQELVTTRFTDGLWYRATVDTVRDQTVVVTLLDYGNTQEVRADRINRLDHALLRYPALGLRCRLSGVTAATPSWDARHLHPSEKLLQARLMEATEPCEVEIIDPAGGTNLNQQLLKQGHVSAASKLPATAQRQTAPTQAQSPKQSIQAPQKPQPVKQPPADQPKRDYVKISDIPVQELEGETMGLVIYFVSPRDFHIQNLAMANTLMELGFQLARYGDQAAKSGAPAVGEVVAAYCQEDEAWYRAEVLGVDGSEAKVHFVDYGNSSRVPVSGTRALRREHAAVARQAVPCLLEAALSEEAAAALQAKVDMVPLGLLVAGCDAGVYRVKDMYNAKTGACILQELREMGLMGAAPATSGTELAPLPPGLFDGRTLPTQHLPDSNVKVKVVHVDSPARFYLQIQEDWCVAAHIKLHKELNAYCTQVRQPYRPRCAGELVCALLDIWYRALVVQVLPDGAGYVLSFIDYGNVETVTNPDSLRVMLKEFTSLPCQAVPCGLVGVQGTGHNGSWADADKSFFTQQFDDTRTLALAPSKDKSGDVHCVDLILEDGRRASQLMVDNKHAVRAGEAAPPTPAAPGGPRTDPPRPQRQDQASPGGGAQPAAPRLEDLPPQTLGQTLDVVMVDVRTPHAFYCQHYSGDANKRLAVIREALIAGCKDTKPDASFTPRVRDLCAAYHQGYGEWYRGRVEAISAQGQKYSVHFLDYGDMLEIAACDLRRLPGPLLAHSAQSIHARLTGVSPLGASSWQSASVAAFSDLTKGCVLTASVCPGGRGRAGDWPISALVNKETGAEVGQELVRRGLAMAATDKSAGSNGPVAANGPPASRSGPPAPQNGPQAPQKDLEAENSDLRRQLDELRQQMALMSSEIQKRT